MLEFANFDTALGTLTIVTLLHELGVPIPMSPAALVAGAQAGAGAIDPLLPIVAIVVATIAGNAAWFAAGRRYGFEVLRLPSRLSPSFARHAEEGMAKFDRWGAWLLVIGRFIPGASLLTPVLAGVVGMRWSKFLLLTAAGSVMQGVAMVWTGMLLRHEVEATINLLLSFSSYALTAVVAALAMYIAWQWRRAASPATIG